MTDINIVKVGMAEFNIITGSGMIKTTGLGSCVGVIIFDSDAQIAGLAHVMLPDSSIAREALFNHAKYADTAIPSMLEKMYNKGARKNKLKAKIAGGAQMFTYSQTNNDMMRIGPRNAESIKEILKELSIPIISEDIGGNYGRTITFQNETSMLLISSIHQGVKEI